MTTSTTHAPSLRRDRTNIVRKVRELRTARKLTQVELSRRLGLSQGRLSEIERGGGSFTAEQFLAICSLFNVPASFFGAAGTPAAEVTNALARHGASHLRESETVLPSERYEEVGALVRETLAAAESARLVAGLAPVIVANIDRLSLEKVQLDLAQAGLGRRFGWLVESTLDALRHELRDAPPRAAWLGSYRRAEVVLASFLRATAPDKRRAKGFAPDVLDKSIRSVETFEEVLAARSAQARRWNIVTELGLEAFAAALRGARVVRA